ncbi:MAG: ethanolamine permease [Pseudomonadota bacterium]
MDTKSNTTDTALDRSLGPLMLWGLGVGYVISGMYFGWNLGLPAGGTLGLAIATGFVIVMYVTFVFGYTELACAIPKAGGAFDYSLRALGPSWGFLGGIAQIVEFVFAPPAIAFAIGAYVNNLYPTSNILVTAIAAYVIFTGLNILGVKWAARFELWITIFAVAELLVFAGVSMPYFKAEHLAIDAFPNGIPGIFAAIPFALWFFLAIEGVANVAEETINPQRNVVLGFSSAIATLVFLCVLTFTTSVGVGGWEMIVYPEGESTASDSPLPLALGAIYGQEHVLYKMLIGIGVGGLIASFHGIILAAGRATFEFGRVGYAPKALGRVHAKFRTPATALVVNMGIGILALFTGKTGDIITLACFGALSLYIISTVSLLVLRKKEPELERPFKTPFYPITPILALSIASTALLAMSVYNPLLALIYYGILGAAFLWFKLFVEKAASNNI